jgi:phosphinothricin acetyltransferase
MELFDRLRRRGFRLLVAGITLPNEASVSIHEALGFEPVGIYRNIGWKAGQWWDVGWWQLDLGEPEGEPPPEPRQ